MSTTTKPPKPKRRWYQFSLMTLLVVMTVSIVAFGGWVQYMRQRAQENRERVATAEKAVETAVAAIENMGVTTHMGHQIMGGDVLYKYEELRSRTWLEELFDDPGGPDDPVGVLRVIEVSLGDNADLWHLKDLTNLQGLYLSNTNVTDDGLEHLKGLANLQILNLEDTKVTDAGLEHLKGLTKLERLILNDTNVTNSGLEHLTGLTNLSSLNLFGTNVTDEGVKKLQQALPNCKIER